MKTYIVDSFTNVPFKGNPAGVCLPKEALTETKMLQIAQELNLSETSYIQPINGTSNNYSIRYFSPKMEIPLCGHATLAAAKVLFENSNIEHIEFTTIENIKLKIKKIGDHIYMQFPIYGLHPTTYPPALPKALGLNEVKEAYYNSETHILMLVTENGAELKNLNPNFIALKESHDNINGVLVTCPAKSDDEFFDFYCRYFWPWSGSNEDPVTGAIQTFLAKYWSDKLGKTSLKSFQASARTGHMEIDIIDDQKIELKCQAKIVFEGSLCV